MHVGSVETYASCPDTHVNKNKKKLRFHHYNTLMVQLKAIASEKD